MSITPKEKQIYEYIEHFIHQNAYAPNFDEAIAFVQQFIEQLTSKGYLRGSLMEITWPA